MKAMKRGAILLVLLWSTQGSAWVQFPPTYWNGEYLEAQWTQSSTAMVELWVGGTGPTCYGRGKWLVYGPCLEDVIRHAAQAWIDTGANINIVFTSHGDPSGIAGRNQCILGDRRSTVSLATSFCGRAFNPWTWATAQGYFYYSQQEGTFRLAEGDIVFNIGELQDGSIQWSSYDGPERNQQIDIHRVAMHEFGHFWGLDHPNQHGQTVSAVMNPGSSPDRLQPDDIAGITTIYPPVQDPIQAQVYAIPPITARDQATVRVHCEGLDGEACAVHLDCTDPEGSEYAGPVPDTIPAFGTRTLTAQDIVEITGGQPWRRRLTCALRSKRAVTGQVWTRSGDVLVNNTAASRSFLLEYAGNTWQAARVYSIPSPTSSDVTNLRIRCETTGSPCENVMLICANDNGELHSGSVVERIKPRATYHMQAAEIERVIDYQWRGMGLSCFVVSTRDISVQVLTRTGGGALVNNSAVDPPLQ